MKNRLLTIALSALLIMAAFPIVSSGATVCYVSATDETRIPAVNYTTSEMSGMQVLSGDVGSYIYGKKGSWAAYNVTLEESGIYKLSLNNKSGTGAFVNVSSNGEVTANVNLPKSAYYHDSVCFATLSKGENALKFFLADGSASILSFTVQLVTVDEGNEKLLLNAINSASCENEIYSAFKAYGKAYGIDIDTILLPIWYKKPVLSRFIGRSYESVGELWADIIKYIEAEQKSPAIALYKGNEQVTEFSSGDLKMVVNTERLRIGSAVCCAVYKKNASGAMELLQVAGSREISASKVTAEFKDLVIDSGDDISWKVICLEDMETIKPYDIYSNIYKELYIATNGSDEGTGTKDDPFATLSRAKEEIALISEGMTGDIVVNIEPGTYFLDKTESFTTDHGGKNGYNVVFKGASAETTVFSGGKRLTDWQKESGGIYSADLDAKEVRNLYVNGIAAIRARSKGCFEYVSDYDDVSDSAYAKDGFITSTKSFPDLAYPDETETVWHIGWQCQRLPIKDIVDTADGKAVLLEADLWYQSQTESATTIKAGELYYIENAFELLDEPGEFYYDKRQKKIFYYPYPEEDLEVCEVYAPLTELLVDIRGESKTDKVSNIVFDGVSFKYGAWNYVSDYGLIGVQSNYFIDNVSGGDGLMLPKAQFALEMADNIKIRNCEFSSLGSSGISLFDGVTNTSITGNIIKDTSGSGIIIGKKQHNNSEITDSMEICRNIKVENNVLHRNATEYRQNAALSILYGNAITVRHNDIYETPYSGMSIGWGWETASLRSTYSRNIDISNNKVEDVMHTLYDGGIIYTLGHLYESKLTGNYLIKNHDKQYQGIYLDAGSSYLNVHDNVVLDAYSEYLLLQSGYAAINNKIYRNYSDAPSYTESGSDETNSVENAIEVEKDNLLPAAQKIADNAGLQDEYKHLLLKAERPSYITHSVNTVPKHEYEEGTIYEAEDFDANYATDIPRVTVYGWCVSFNKDQWLEYKINAPKAGKYNLSVNAGVKSTAVTLSFDVNSVENVLSGSFAPTGGYNTCETQYLGSIELNEGENTVRINNKDAGMHFDYFVLD